MQKIYTDIEKETLKKEMNRLERRKNSLLWWQLGELGVFLMCILLARGSVERAIIFLLLHFGYTFGWLKYSNYVGKQCSEARLKYWYALGGIKYEKEDN